MSALEEAYLSLEEPQDPIISGGTPLEEGSSHRRSSEIPDEISPLKSNCQRSMVKKHRG